MATSNTTEKLRINLLDQHSRLLHQLADLEECKDDMTEEEYEESKQATIEELSDINASLAKITNGGITLENQDNLRKEMVRNAISNAFKTPEVIRMFARREPDQLKLRKDQVERDFKLGKISREQWLAQRREVLLALQQLGDTLTSDEISFLSSFNTSDEFERVKTTANDLSTALRWAHEKHQQ